MNLIAIFRHFPDQQACITHLEDVRWGYGPHCPQCGSIRVARKCDGDRIGRWNCHECNTSFNVLSGTIFEKTRVPLQKWFLAIGLMVNSKKSLSSYQLARDIDLTHQTALYMQQRIRAAMASEQVPLLHGIVEADETYIGGKPRKGNRRRDDEPGAPRGRATRKMSIIGAVERRGHVSARVANNLSGKSILSFLKQTVDPTGTLLITDEYKAYKATKSSYNHASVNHSATYVDGKTHTNTVEGFWALLKRAWYGSHHHYSHRLAPLFVAEASWKYNHRGDSNAFGLFLRGAMA